MMSPHSLDLQRSMEKFQGHYDSLANATIGYFNHYLERLFTYLERDQIAQSVLTPVLTDTDISIAYGWLKYHSERTSFRRRQWQFPEKHSEELALRFYLMQCETSGEESSFVDLLFASTPETGAYESINLFITVIVEPFYVDMCELMENASNDQSKDTQNLLTSPQVVPAENESRIFLSHKSEDKALVRRYHAALTALGYAPWIDETDILTGDEIDRSIDQGIRQSCAVVFFVTENFRDNTYLRDEINYAKRELREKDNRFRIITLRFSKHAKVPNLLDQYRYEDVENDLEGLAHIIRALPIELGPICWKDAAVK